MGQQPRAQLIMNPNTPARSPGYHQKAMEEIQNSLRPFAKSGSEAMSSSAASTISNFSATSGVSSLSSTSGGNGNEKDMVLQLRQLGYSEESSIRALQLSNGRLDVALDYLGKPSMDPSMKPSGYTKLIRKPSIERELMPRGSPALDSGAGSSRSDSPRLAEIHSRYSPNFNEPPPPPPPRNTPPPPPPHGSSYQPVPSNVQQMFKRMSPAPVVPARTPTVGSSYNSPALQQRGTSPVSSVSSSSGRQPMVVQNGPQVQQQLSQQMQALSLYQSSTASTSEPPPPYPLISTNSSNGPPPPPSYSASIQNRQSPTQDFRKSPSSGIYSGSASTGSPSPIPVSTTTASAGSMARPTPLQAWGARQTISQPPIIMQSVKSTQVQKPVLQTAIAPTAPQIPSPTTTTPPATSAPPPSYTVSIQQKGYTNNKPAAPLPAPSSSTNVTPVTIPTTEPPSYASTMQAKAKAQRGTAHPPLPPPPYSDENHVQVYTVDSSMSPRASPHVHAPLQRKYSPIVNNECRSDSPQSTSSGDSRNQYSDNGAPPLPPTASSSVKSNSSNNNNHAANCNGDHKINEVPPQLPPYTKIKHQSPIPERKKISKEKEEERRDGKVKNYSPQAFKFFMEQHIENVIKSYRQRMFRRMQLEKEMNKIGLSPEAQMQMRKMLSQKESNYIRLKRAKMDKSMFVRIKPIGVGAFGEVTLVRKIDTNHLYAMKTLRKAEVLKRNQVAHVKAERDILAEADNEWVVKLYYSFQDSDILYFVMDYIPGGDLMSLLIKLGIFEERLARFYIAELTCAVDSVHNMGFIHRDIKPDNILIDKDGHIKLTDFGLCTGFRWTHNSKYYQPLDHSRQDSMDPIDDWEECKCKSLKPLERRRRREHRCLAHSLVGTPNYIAPEVLQRIGYTHVCDWWSVGVILYEMLVGQPPFLANTPAETQYKVINWETTLQIPKQANLSKESTDLILKLCCSADKRLGKNDSSEVKSHPFFKAIDYEKGLRRQPAPHKPRIDYPTDTSNFDPIDPDRLRNSTSLDSSTSEEFLDNSKLFHGFFEFTFRRFFDDGGLAAFNKINLDDNDNQGGPVYV
ncbi:hypothetical protein JTB14_005967 [Gonioctena quinquepunctata]|nr:hypothetical protein JTB14_005967 [Gonioctena quinquepunctata]